MFNTVSSFQFRFYSVVVALDGWHTANQSEIFLLKKFFGISCVCDVSLPLPAPFTGTAPIDLLSSRRLNQYQRWRA